jgi:hypothetical protein
MSLPVAMVALILFGKMSDLPVATVDLGYASGFVNSPVAKSVDTVTDGCSDDKTHGDWQTHDYCDGAIENVVECFQQNLCSHQGLC